MKKTLSAQKFFKSDQRIRRIIRSVEDMEDSLGKDKADRLKGRIVQAVDDFREKIDDAIQKEIIQREAKPFIPEPVKSDEAESTDDMPRFMSEYYRRKSDNR